MTKEIVFKMIQIIKKNYGYAYKDLNSTEIMELVEFWYDCLKGYDREIVAIAFKKTLVECKMQPTLADIVERIKEIQNAGCGADAELWETIDTARKKVVFCYMFDGQPHLCGDKMIYPAEELERIYETLPAVAKTYLGNKHALLALAHIKDEVSLDIEKTRFMKTIGETKRKLEIKQTYPQLVAEQVLKLTDTPQNK